MAKFNLELFLRMMAHPDAWRGVAKFNGEISCLGDTQEEIKAQDWAVLKISVMKEVSEAFDKEVERWKKPVQKASQLNNHQRK